MSEISILKGPTNARKLKMQQQSYCPFWSSYRLNEKFLGVARRAIREAEQIPAYELTIAKGGLKIKP